MSRGAVTAVRGGALVFTGALGVAGCVYAFTAIHDGTAGLVFRF